MKQRNLLTLLLLSIVTLGIYQLFWLKQTRDEMVSKGAKIPSFWQLCLPILVIVVLTLALMVFSAASEPTIDASSSLVGILTVLAVIIAIVSIPLVVLHWFYRYCYAVEVVTRGKTNFGLTYVLFIVFSLFSISIIWPLIIQDGFNKIEEDHKPSHPHKPRSSVSNTGSGPILYSR